MALSHSFNISESAAQIGSASKDLSSSASRHKQVAILYLVNDLLHHTKFHPGASAVYITLTSAFRTYLELFFKAAATYDTKRFVKHNRKVTELLDLWEQRAYFNKEIIDGLRDVAADPSKANVAGVDGSLGTGATTVGGDTGLSLRDVPFTLPHSHGENSTPFYDLPAGNLLPHIKPNSSSSIDTRLVRPLQLSAGPADERLVGVVKAFLDDVQALYSEFDFPEKEDATTDFDELGQSITRDETGEIFGGESYYGWSKAFCTKMKRRHGGRGPPDGDEQDYKRDRSESPRKRWRSTSFESHESRGETRSRSPFQRGFGRLGHTRARTPLDDRTHSQQWHSKSFRRRSPSRSSSRSYSPPQAPNQPSHRTPDSASDQQEKPRPTPVQQFQPPLPQALVFGP